MQQTAQWAVGHATIIEDDESYEERIVVFVNKESITMSLKSATELAKSILLAVDNLKGDEK